MLRRNHTFVESLRTLIEDEYEVHREYLRVIAEEQVAISKFQTALVAQLTEKRERLCEAMRAAEDRRLSLIRAHTGSDQTIRLSDFIAQHLDPDQVKLLAPSVRRLREVVSRSRKIGAEFQQILNLSMTLVSGTLSLIWSATQRVTRSYSKHGGLKESYQPAGAATLKQA